MSSKIKKAIKFFLIEPTLNIKIPVWLIIFALFIPVMAYIDLIFAGKHSYIDYIILCTIETILIGFGYVIGRGVNILKEWVM